MNCDLGSHFSRRMSAHAIRHNEQRQTRIDEVIVLVVIALTPNVRRRIELNL